MPAVCLCAVLSGFTVYGNSLFLHYVEGCAYGFKYKRIVCTLTINSDISVCLTSLFRTSAVILSQVFSGVSYNIPYHYGMRSVLNPNRSLGRIYLDKSLFHILSGLLPRSSRRYATRPTAQHRAAYTVKTGAIPHASNS